VLSGLHWGRQAIIIASKDFRMNKEGATGKGKHVTVAIAQKLEIIQKFVSGESRSMIMAA